MARDARRWEAAAATLAVLGAIGTTFAVSETATWFRLKWAGVPADAVVVACVFNPADERSDSFDIAYELTPPGAGGARFRGTTTSTWRMQLGAAVRVVYLPADPAVSRPAGKLGAGAVLGPLVLLGISLPFAALGLILLALRLRDPLAAADRR